jgi:hypothetical protein
LGQRSKKPGRRTIVLDRATIARAAAGVAYIASLGNAWAAPLTCNSISPLSVSNREAAIGGKRLCVGSPGNWHDQELHTGAANSPSGSITEPLNGTIGSYTIVNSGGNGVITYTYTTGSSPGYIVSQNGTTLFFCDTAGESVLDTATIETGSTCT